MQSQQGLQHVLVEVAEVMMSESAGTPKTGYMRGLNAQSVLDSTWRKGGVCELGAVAAGGEHAAEGHCVACC